MRFVLLAALALAASACTAANPDYVPPATGCMLGERTCLGTRPEECVPSGASDGGTALRNALCPASGTCQGGRCMPPSGARPCVREADCVALGETCTAFVDPTGTVSTFCAPPEGFTPGALSCGVPMDCRSNLCLTTMGPSTKQVCFLACSADADCPPQTKCRRFVVTITDVMGNLQGCAPR